MYCTTVGSETAWHCLYCKMPRKKLGWARVCVTVWECVDRLSEKSSNYDELAGYWFLDEFLSCLASIMSVIHAAPHGTPRTGPGGGCEKVSSTKKCSPTLLSRNSLCENSTLSAKAQFCQNTQNIPPCSSELLKWQCVQCSRSHPPAATRRGDSSPHLNLGRNWSSTLSNKHVGWVLWLWDCTVPSTHRSTQYN